jgi:hypothetical protein
MKAASQKKRAETSARLGEAAIVPRSAFISNDFKAAAA